MYTLSKVRPLVARLGLLAALLLLSVALPHPAVAQDEPDEAAEEAAEQEAAEEEAAAGDPACAASGYVVDSPEGLADLRTALRNETVHELDGVPLDRVDTWVLPDGATPVVVIDSSEPLPGGEVSAMVAGTTFPIRSDTVDQDAERRRYVPNVSTPQLGSVVRTMGLEVQGGRCAVAVVLSVDRSLLSTVAGGTAVALTALFGLLTVLVARLRKGGWLRRFLSAAPLGLLAGTSAHGDGYRNRAIATSCWSWRE